MPVDRPALFCPPFRRATVLAGVLSILLAILLAAPLTAAEPELVGAVALALEHANAEALGLTEAQRDALYDLVDDREMQGISLALKFKDLPRDERLKRLAAFREESVRRGLAVLNPKQRARLAELRAVADDPAYKTASAEPAAAPAAAEAKPIDQPTGSAAADGQPDQGQTAKPLPARGSEDFTPTAGGRLSFNFRYQPWQDVLDWFAGQADLSLVLESPPTGTFNYQDNRSYTVGEALDVLNSVLLTKGYTLVRKGRMLLLVNLEDGIPPNLVTDVPLNELDERGEYELVRVLFRVRNLLPEDAAEELRQLMGPQGTILVLPKAGMIQVTETAGRIRTLRGVIEAIEQPGADGPVREFPLEYASADDVLPVLRQMLGIPGDAMATPTGSLQLAVDPLGTKLFVQGATVQLRRFEEVLRLVDVPGAAAQGVDRAPQLEVYPIATIDPELALKVLQEILAGNELTRLSVDAQTGNLVALATPDEHATIRATLGQMQQDSRRIEVIPLATVDPQLAVLSINKLFAAATGGDEPDPRAPIVDADLASSSLMVRASPAQIDQIKDFLKQLGEGQAASASATSGGNVRLLPLSPSASRSALGQVQQLWPLLRPNRIRIVTPSAPIPSYRPSGDEPAPVDPLEQLLRSGNPFGGPEQDAAPTSGAEDRSASAPRVSARFAAQTTEPPTSRPGAEIIVVPGPAGTVIASQDLDALDAFEQLLRNSVSQAGAASRQFAVFYLKHAEATVAAETLAKVFGASTGGDGGLVGGLADAALGGLGGGLVGDLLGLGGGDGAAVGFSSTSVDIVPDVRLNALVVYAQPTDLDTIDQLLRILDQRTGPEPVEAGGKPRLIAVVNTSATTVAEVVKQVFADRIQSSGGAASQPSPEELFRALRRGAGGGGGGSTDQEPSKMSIGVDLRSNSLVVRAPDPLFAQVEQLVRQLDAEGAGRPQATRIVSLEHTNTAALRQTLNSLLGQNMVTTGEDSAASSGEPQANSNGRNGRGDSGAQTREMMQRIEAFRRFRDLQQGGGRGQGRGRGQRGEGGGRGGARRGPGNGNGGPPGRGGR